MLRVRVHGFNDWRRDSHLAGRFRRTMSTRAQGARHERIRPIGFIPGGSNKPVLNRGPVYINLSGT